MENKEIEPIWLAKECLIHLLKTFIISAPGSIFEWPTLLVQKASIWKFLEWGEFNLSLGVAEGLLCKGSRRRKSCSFSRKYDVGSHSVQKLFPDFCGRLFGIGTGHLYGRMSVCSMGFPVSYDGPCYSWPLPMGCSEFYLSCHSRNHL